jgi:hypothetical protein
MAPRAVSALSLALVALAATAPVSSSRRAGADGYASGTRLGWRTHEARHFETPLDGPCTVDRVDASQFASLEAFHDAHRARGGAPVVVTGLAPRNDAFRAMNAKEALLRRWGDETIVLSTANTHSYRKVAKTLREYFDDHLRVQDLAVPGDETLYWFGDNDHERWAEHFAAYSPPPLIPRSADVAYSFGIGGPLSGVPLHVHGPGFSETLIGRKRWWLAPPRPKPAFDPNATALEWALSSRSGGGGAPTKGNGDGGVDFAACTVAEGEAIYFPDGWWHATLNLDETVFISSFVNYARDEQGERGADVTGKRPDLDDAFELKR